MSSPRRYFWRVSSTRVIIILLFLCDFPYAVFGISFSLFEKQILTQSKLTRYQTFPNAHVSGACALECSSGRQASSPRCKGYQHDPLEKTCELYTIGDTLNTFPSVALFVEKTRDMFQTIEINGSQYSIYISDVKKPFADARTHCHQVGGHLLEIDSLDKFAAVERIATGEIDFAWVGAIESSGVWVTDREGTAISQDLLLWQLPSEPSNGFKEDCMMIRVEIMKFHDAECDAVKWFVCERHS